MSLDWLKVVGGLLGTGLLTGVIWGPIGILAGGLFSIADAAIGLLPDATDLGLVIPGGWIYGYSIVNTFLPLTEALAFAGVFVSLIVGGIVFRTAVTIYHLIPKPGVGT
jgi:hypothetical protein